MKKIPLRWLLAGGVVYVVLIAVLSLAFIFPQNLKIGELKAKLHSDTGQATALQKGKEAAALRKELRETQAALASRLLVPEKVILARVVSLAQKSQIQMLSVLPLPQTAGANQAGEYSVQVSFSGTYRQALDFVYLLETDRIMFRVEKFTLENKDNVRQGEVTVATLAR